MIPLNRPSLRQPIPNPPFKKSESPLAATAKVDQVQEVQEVVKPSRRVSKVRARNVEGEYKGDDPSTPENEAWVLIEGENND